MRLILTALAFALLPMSGAAQSPARDARPQLPPIGLPLAPIGLPLAPIGLPPPPDLPGSRGMSPHKGAAPEHRSSRFNRDRRVTSPVVVYVTPYPWFWPYWDESVVTMREPAAPQPAAYSTPPARPEPATGLLRFEVDLAPEAQLYVDGYFVGTVAEIGSEFRLHAGAHAIQVRADGFEPLSFEVVITPGRSITWRGGLKPSTPAAAPLPAAPAAESIFYLIPGCYMGNVHPREVELPAGCDVSRMIVRRMR